MNDFRSLTFQTLIYGSGTIIVRFVNLLLTPLITYFFAETGNGIIANIYAFIAFLNILYLFGAETSYFKFTQDYDEKKVFHNLFSFILINTILWTLILYVFQDNISKILGLQNFRLLSYIPIIVSLDTISAIVFCRLRYFKKALWFVGLKLTAVVVNVSVLYLFIISDKVASILPVANKVEYVFIANILGSLISFAFLLFKTGGIRISLDINILKTMLRYSLPLLIVGFGGMINEVLDRILLLKLAQGSYEQRLYMTGVYAAAYKLSILITIMIYAFKMGAEPFFFKLQNNKNAPETYAKIMSVFVYILGIGFLLVVLFLDYWKYFISAQKHAGFSEGLAVVPILLFANIFLGIYYNLSIAFKLKLTTLYGAIVTSVGVAITLIINYMFIPIYGFYASAWATLLCYGTMTMLGFLLFRKLYYIPYRYFEILLLLGTSLVFYLLHSYCVEHYSLDMSRKHILSIFLICTYVSLFYFTKVRKYVGF